MHPRTATLIAYCDSELGRRRAVRVASHLARCSICAEEVQRVEHEKGTLAGAARWPVAGVQPDLSRTLASISAWLGRQGGWARTEVRARLGLLFGSGTASASDRMLSDAEVSAWEQSLLTTFLGRKAYARAAFDLAAVPRAIILLTSACVAAGFLGWSVWLVTGQPTALRLFFDYPGSLLLAALGIAELCLSALALSGFAARGGRMATAWLLITLAAGCRAAGGMLANVFAVNARLNPLLWAGHPEPARLDELRKVGLMFGGPFELVLLAAGLALALRAYRLTGLWAPLRRRDWGLLAAVGAFTLYQLWQVAQAFHAGASKNVFGLLDLANDPLLSVLLAEAILLHRSVSAMGNGLIARCWGSFTAAVFLTSVGDVGLWLSNYSYLPWSLRPAFWLVWLPAAAAFALAPAYQVLAQSKATRPPVWADRR